MSTEQYPSWEDLLAEEAVADASSTISSLPPQDTAAQGHAGSGLPEGFELPEELRTLFAERERLERELKELTGEAEPTTEEERLKRMFPVKVHTKESRIEERRQRQRDEQKQMLEKRILEARRLHARLGLRREELREEQRRKAAEAERVRERWVRERAQAALEAERRRTFEAAWQSRRELLAQSRREWRNCFGQRDARIFEAAREASAQRTMEARKALALTQRALGQHREQQESDELREARAQEADRENQRQNLRDQRRQERLQEQRGARQR